MALKNIRMSDDYILIEPVKGEEEVGGIIKPEQYESKVSKGKIRKKGKNCPLKIGTLIFFNQYSPEDMTDDGNKYLILHTQDIKGWYD